MRFPEGVRGGLIRKAVAAFAFSSSVSRGGRDVSIDVHANARRLDRAMALLLLSRADIGRDRNCLLVLAECIDAQQARFPALPDERAFAWGRVSRHQKVQH